MTRRLNNDNGLQSQVVRTTAANFRVLDSLYFVPQHRESIIIVGFNRKVFKGNEKFDFPVLPEPNKKIGDILEENPSSKYTLSDKLWEYLQSYAAKYKAKGNGFGLGVITRDVIYILVLVFKYMGRVVAVTYSARVLSMHIRNEAKHWLPIQSLTQIAS